MKTMTVTRWTVTSVFLLGLLALQSGTNGLTSHLLVPAAAADPGSQAPKPADPARPAPKAITIWKEYRTLQGHRSSVWCVAFSPDGTRLATGSGGYLGQSGELKIWDPIRGRELVSVATARSVRWVQFAPDGKSLAAAEHEDAGAANLRETVTGKVLHTLVGHHKSIDTLAFSPDGKQLVTASWDKTVKLWSTQTGKELQTLAGHAGEVYPVAFSPDGRWVLSGDRDGVAILWDADSGKQRRVIQAHANVVQGVAFAKDGQTLATASWDKTVKLWKPDTGKELATLKGHTLPVLGVMFSPDGRTLASVSGKWGSDDDAAHAGTGEVIVWDLGTQKEVATLQGHTDRIFGVAFSPDGKLLATASWDRTVKIWRGLRAQAAVAPLTPKDLGELWDQLARDNLVEASTAAEILAGAPRQTIPFLGEHLRAVRPADSERRIATLLLQLDDDTFIVRKKAELELAKLGPGVIPHLRQALQKKISAEVRQRVERLLAKLKAPELTAPQKRLQWAVLVLELTGTREARQALEGLAEGSAGAWLALEARASLHRLGKGTD